MEKTDNPYRILGLGEDADEATIKKAYRKLAIKYHPDKQTNDADREAATAEFAKIADAYDLLNDPVRRYDWRQANQSSTPAPSPSTAGSPRTRPMRSLSPKRNGSENKPGTSKRSTVNRSTSPMPMPKKASVQPNSVRVSPENPLARPSVRVPAGRMSMAPNVARARQSVRSPVRNSGGRSPVRNSGGRSPVRNAASKSPMRNSGRSPMRTGGAMRNSSKSPMRSSAGRSPMRTSTAIVPQHGKPLRNPAVPANNEHTRGRAPVSRMNGAAGVPGARRPSAGRKKTRPSSVGRKPRKANDLDVNSEHGRRKPAGERRRKLKKSLSLKLQ